MACGRAAYVLDVVGGDGWVTEERYPAMEADNFSGQATEWSLDRERLIADLADYRPDMGQVNRDLVLTHHDARSHAYALVALFRRLSPRPEPVTPDFASMMMSSTSISLALASGTSASSTAVG